MDELNNKSPDFRKVITVGGALFAFGIFFNKFTEHVNKQSWGEERSAILVAIGVSVTALLRRALPFDSILWDFFAYACSGIPMIWGQYDRFEKRKRAALRRHLNQK